MHQGTQKAFRFEKPIYVTRPHLPEQEKYQALLTRIWASNQITNNGPILIEYENAVARYLGVEYISAVTNGHLGLDGALRTLRLTGEVITTPFTFPSTTHALVQNNLTPVFCDILEDSFNIDHNKIEALITPKTSAIFAVHVFGNPCNVEAIQAIAEKHGISVVYDAAHAFGTSIGGVGIANYGDASVFSTHATKVFNSIEGGLVYFKSYDNQLLLRRFRNFGYAEAHDERVTVVGSNYKMSEFHAAAGLINIGTIEQQILRRKQLFDIYRERLSGLEGIRLTDLRAENINYNYAYAPVRINESVLGKSRKNVVKYLSDLNIFAREYFSPLTTDLDCYRDQSFYCQSFPVAQQVTREILCLPLYPSLSDSEILNICQAFYDLCDS